MIGLKQLRAVNSLEQLESLKELGNVFYDISSRGGGVGFYSKNVAKHFKIDENLLPPKFGAGCNYLGGGIRGSIFPSTFSPDIEGRKRDLLEALAQACIRVYKNMEEENDMNDEEYEDGEEDWDNIGTNAARNAGIESAY